MIFEQRPEGKRERAIPISGGTNIAGGEKSKNTDILKSVVCVGIAQIISLGRSLAFSFKPGSQGKHLSKRERLWSSLASAWSGAEPTGFNSRCALTTPLIGDIDSWMAPSFSVCRSWLCVFFQDMPSQDNLSTLIFLTLLSFCPKHLSHFKKLSFRK